MAPVTLNVVCFRYVRPGLDDAALDALNKGILIELQEQGIAAPSGTVIRGKYVLRVAHVNHRSRWEDFDILVREAIRIGEELAQPDETATRFSRQTYIGSATEALEGLIDAGIDGPRAWQFSAKGMDPAVFKRRFGDRFCFEGGVSVQITLPFGTPEDVRAEVEHLISTRAKTAAISSARSDARHPPRSRPGRRLRISWRCLTRRWDSIRSRNSRVGGIPAVVQARTELPE